MHCVFYREASGQCVQGTDNTLNLCDNKGGRGGGQNEQKLASGLVYTGPGIKGERERETGRGLFNCRVHWYMEFSF